MTKVASSSLTGKALLQKLKESDLPRRELAKECGYYTVAKNGQTRTNLSEFYDAVLAAKGVTLEPGMVKSGRGKEATYRVKVHQNGQIVIGSTYTEQMELKPGNEFQVKLGHKHIHLILIDDTKTEAVEEA